jgi:hypothetical protein
MCMRKIIISMICNADNPSSKVQQSWCSEMSLYVIECSAIGFELKCIQYPCAILRNSLHNPPNINSQSECDVITQGKA